MIAAVNYTFRCIIIITFQFFTNQNKLRSGHSYREYDTPHENPYSQPQENAYYTTHDTHVVPKSKRRSKKTAPIDDEPDVQKGEYTITAKKYRDGEREARFSTNEDL